MTYQVAIVEDYGRNSMKRFTVHDTELPNTEARFAFALIEKWGLVAAMPDGEDSSGRSKLRLPTTDELTVRAFDMAASAYAEMRKRGLAITAPDISELLRKTDD